VLDARLKISLGGHQALQIGILLLVYGLISLWLKANSSALSRIDQAHDQGRIRVMRVLVPRLPDSDEDTGPMFELPLAEDKGTLSDTFEIDYIDAEISPEEPIDGRVVAQAATYRDHQ
jgi:hypothetical protein